MTEPLLEVRGLRVTMRTPAGELVAAEGVDFDILPGELMGMVGESGSGKSVVLKAILGLLPAHADVTGSIRWRGTELVGADAKTWKQVRGSEIGMVFQDPMTALNPLRRISAQLAEVPRRVHGWSRAETARNLAAMLDEVGIRDPQRVLASYPHQLSGGMRQRVLIAMTFATNPALVLCDEPTTALDVSVQAQILDLIRERSAASGAAVLFVSHDLAVVDGLCSGVQVMYSGQIVERGPIREVFSHPRHAYTAALLASLPRIEGGRRRPASIPGELPDRFNRPVGCRFHRRCTVSGETCPDEPYRLRVVDGTGLGDRTPRRADGTLERGSSCYYDHGFPVVPISAVPAVRGAA